MLKRKRKINKALLIASSRRYTGPLPLAYAALLEVGVPSPWHWLWYRMRSMCMTSWTPAT